MGISLSDLDFLNGMLHDVKESATVHPGQRVGSSPVNALGFAVTRPGGRDCYPAFWIRDFAMSLESGCVPTEELRNSLILTAENQADVEVRLPTGAAIPSGSIPDHITFGGSPIYYPGTFDPNAQGGEPWGVLPSLDDQYYFIEMAHRYVSSSGDAGILHSEIRGKRLLTRLEEAFTMPPHNPDTGAISCTEQNRGVSFGFTDSIYHTGDLLFCTLLKCRAARHLEFLFSRARVDESAHTYGDVYRRLKTIIPDVFGLAAGMLRASTGTSCQPDVWGTAFAVYEELLAQPYLVRASAALLSHINRGEIAWRGNIRHVPESSDFSPTTAWERTTGGRKNTYQNGSYWGTPVGWVALSVSRIDSQAAGKILREYITELREGDYRKGVDFGSPWECMHPEGAHRQNPVYLTSVSCPAAATYRMQRSGAIS